jgi:hypothetical protein
MGILGTKDRTLHATLCEIERGLFHISYRGDTLDRKLHPLPPYQVGTCASDAQRKVEQLVRQRGYELVIWEPALAIPDTFAIMADTVSRPR